MAHPLLTASTKRLISTAVIGAAMILPSSAAFALTGIEAEVLECPAGEVADAVTGLCEAVLDEVGATVDALPSELAEPVLDAVPADLLPEFLPEVLPSDEPEPAAPAQEVAPAPATAGGGTSTTPAPAPAEESQSVRAAGKTPTEVTEPAGPAADNRVATGPTIQPANLGVNIPGVRSESGLTLQPYEAPMVSIPTAMAEVPQVAGVSTTAAPAQAAAAEVMALAGSALVPHTTGSAGWVTATGLGLLGGAAFATRRRLSTLGVTTLDD